MNNCPKCGNPLQVGTSSCPICGTNTSADAQPAKTTVTVASVATPVNQQPAPEPKTEAPTVAVTPVAEAPAPTTEAPTQAPAQQPTQPATQPVQQPAQPAPTTETPATPVTAAPAPVATEPATQPVQPAQPVDPNSIAPTIKTVDLATPVPSIPASLNPDAQTIVAAPASEPVKSTKNKKALNKNVLIIGIAALVVVAIGAFLLTGGMGKKTQAPTPNATTNAVAVTSVSTNGYKLNLQDGWIITEDGDNVIITNSEETAAIKLSHSAFGISSISKETIEYYFQTRSDFTNTEISEMTLSAKEGYLVNTNIQETPVQLYFIGGGANLTIGATIVYHSTETKTKYEPAVTEMLGSLSYSDESLKAMTTIDMYSDVFGIYNGVIAQAQNQQTPQTPVVNEPVDNNTQENTEQPNESENNNQVVEENQNTGTSTDQ